MGVPFLCSHAGAPSGAPMVRALDGCVFLTPDAVERDDSFALHEEVHGLRTDDAAVSAWRALAVWERNEVSHDRTIASRCAESSSRTS